MRLFVGNLPWKTTEDDLEALFKDYGDITSVQICQREGRSRGFGFIEFSERGDGLQAIEELNGEDIGGRTLHVSEALAKNSYQSKQAGR